MEIKQQLFDHIDSRQNDAVATLQRLVQFPTVNPPGNEKGHQDYIAAELQALGLDVKMIEAIEGRPNLVAILHGAGGGNNLLHYAGHADVVSAGDESKWTFPPFSGEVHDGWIYGRGAVDHKAPIAASLVAIRAIVENGIKLNGDIVFLVPVDEELGSMYGTKYLLEQDALYGDMGIYASAGFLEQVLISCSGSVRFDVEIFGRTAHGGYAHRGINAVEKASKLVLALQSMEFDKVNPFWEPGNEHDRLKPTRTGSLTVTRIEGGTGSSVVPDKCIVQASRRLIPNETVDEAKQQIEAVLQQLRSDDPDYQAEVRYVSTVNGINTSADNPIVDFVSSAVRDIGLEPQIDGSSGGFDARWIVDKLGIPFVSYGAGWNGPDGGLCLHTENEAITIDNLMGMARAYAMIMVRTCGIAE
jgi:succinyl-diaminopimelate desuccinylase